MKKLFAIAALVFCSSAYSQSFHFDEVKTLDIKELTTKLDATSILTKEEKSKINTCLTSKDFVFEKNNYYACIKGSMSQIHARELMALKPLNNEREMDNATPLPTQSEINIIKEKN